LAPANPAPPTAATDHRGESGLLTQLFGFVQFEFAGTLAVADGRYLAQEPEQGSGRQSVLVIETLGAPAPAPASRRRRRPRQVDPDADPGPLPLTRATAVRAFEPFANEAEAGRWLDGAVETEESVEALLEDGIGLLNRALHVHGAASGNPYAQELSPERAAAARIGFGSGEEVAVGDFSAAHEVDARATGASPRRQRAADLRPQERLAAVLGGREALAACETLIPRARADLDGGREREAALQLRVGLEALLAEIPATAANPDHGRDMAALRERRGEAGEAANMALKGDLTAEVRRHVCELLEICERILRRRRVLAG
jgi:hypothetical protein